MSTEIPLLSNVKIAAPCSASWNEMDAVDGDRVHFCAGCKKNVYNLSAMTQNQAEGLLRKHEGHLCVRYYKRTDGTILTQNCPVGQAAVRMKMIARSKQAALAATVLASIGAFGTAVNVVHNRNAIMGGGHAEERVPTAEAVTVPMHDSTASRSASTPQPASSTTHMGFYMEPLDLDPGQAREVTALPTLQTMPTPSHEFSDKPSRPAEDDEQTIDQVQAEAIKRMQRDEESRASVRRRSK